MENQMNDFKPSDEYREGFFINLLHQNWLLL